MMSQNFWGIWWTQQRTSLSNFYPFQQVKFHYITVAVCAITTKCIHLLWWSFDVQRYIFIFSLSCSVEAFLSLETVKAWLQMSHSQGISLLSATSLSSYHKYLSVTEMLVFTIALARMQYSMLRSSIKGSGPARDTSKNQLSNFASKPCSNYPWWYLAQNWIL